MRVPCSIPKHLNTSYCVLIQDALDGKIDLILTKSVSRFARNTADTLTTVRKLKERDIEACFEKENIYTLDAKGGADHDHAFAGAGREPEHPRERCLG